MCSPLRRNTSQQNEKARADNRAHTACLDDTAASDGRDSATRHPDHQVSRLVGFLGHGKQTYRRCLWRRNAGIYLDWSGTYPSINTPSLNGWSSVGSSAPTGNDLNIFALVRVADGTEGSSFTFNFSASSGVSEAVIIAYSGVNNVSPTDGSAFAEDQYNDDAVTVTGFNTTVNGDQLVGCGREP